MYNWSIDEEKFKEADPEGYEIWKLEQMINWGLGDDKLNEKLLRRHWKKLFLDPIKKQFLEFLLWPERTKTSTNKKF